MTIPVLSTAPDWDPLKPSQRIYVGGFQYRLVAPTFVRPPLAQTVKLIWNWVSAAGRTAKNIMFVEGSGGAPLTDPAFLKQVANAVMTAWSGSGNPGKQSNQWTLSSVTAKDNSGASETSVNSDHSPIPGGASLNPLPPQVAVVVSWQIAASYRGGKPRTYTPGLATDVVLDPAGSQLVASFATNWRVGWNSFAASVNSSSPGGHDIILGTISYQTGHSPRPTPLFRPFGDAHVHERLDSQRRRSGRESLFPAVP